MALLKVVISDTVEQNFRKTAMERFGYSKGALSRAAEEALDQWLEMPGEFVEELQALGNPVKAISGMLKHVKKSSVELQHQVKFIRSEKYVRTRR